MGHRPCQVEAECRKQFLEHLGPIGIDWKAGGESYADLYIRRSARGPTSTSTLSASPFSDDFAAADSQSSSSSSSSSPSSASGSTLPPKANAGPWSLLQLKTTTERTAAWNRKMRHKLRTEKEALHGVIFIGYSSTDATTILIERVHRKKNYDDYDPSAPENNIRMDELAEVMDGLCGSGMGIQLDENHEPAAEVLMAYSEETLKEKRARAFFIAALRRVDEQEPASAGASPTSASPAAPAPPPPPVRLEYTAAHLPHGAEYSCVDGVLSCSWWCSSSSSSADASDLHHHDHLHAALEQEDYEMGGGRSTSSSTGLAASHLCPGTVPVPGKERKSKQPRQPPAAGARKKIEVRIQEKLMSVRKERGKEYGLRCPMRRGKKGKSYHCTDADFLLLHARADATASAAPSRPARIASNAMALHGSALIPFRVLAEAGIVASGSDQQQHHVDGGGENAAAKPGRTCLAMYPTGAPGVPAHRGTSTGLLEKYYVPHGPDFCQRLARIISEEQQHLHALADESALEIGSPHSADHAGADGIQREN